MKEMKIYLTEDFHTGQLQEASKVLLTQNVQITKICTENLKAISPYVNLSPEVVQDRVQHIVAPHYIPPKIIARWNKDEAWVSRMLVKAKAMVYPEHTDQKLSEQLSSISRFMSVEAALGYIATIEKRAQYLLSIQSPEHVSLISYGAFAYVESRILRKVIFNGVYLTNNKLAVIPNHLSPN